MGQKFKDEAGNIWEMGANGQPSLVSGAKSPAIGQAIGNDPRIPGTMHAQDLQATRTQQEISNNPLSVANTRTNIAQGNNSINQSRIGNVQELRKEFNALPEVKNYSEILTQMGKSLRAPNTPQGDLAVIYAFAKAMDPGSVVREGEMDMANSTSSTIQDIYRRYGKIQDGNRLPPEVRHGLIESIRSSGRAMNDSYGQRYRQYRDQAEALGADPKQVVGNHLGDAFRPLEEKYIKESKFRSAPTVGSEAADLDENGNPLPVLHGASVGDPRKAALKQRIEGTDAFGSGMVGAADSMTFGLADEASAGMNALGGALSGKGSFSSLYHNNLSDERAYQDTLRARDPKSFFAGNVAGAVGGMGGLSAGLRLSGRLAPLATKAGGIGTDMLYGAGYGAGSSDDSRLAGAGLGAAAAGAGNLVGRYAIAPAIRGGASAVGHGVAPLPAGQGMIANQALKADPNEVLGRLQQASDLNMPYSLADADPRLRSLAGSAVRKSPDAFALASQTVGPRAAGQAERAIGLIDENLAPHGEISQITADATKRAQGASAPLYKKAMQHPAPGDAQLDEILRTPAGEQAARDAYTRALNAGEKPGDLSFEVDSITGVPRLQGKPNWRTLQYMKFELDRAAQSDPTLVTLSKRFTGRLGALNKDFASANKAYGNVAKQGEAAQAGYGATAVGQRPAQTAQSLSNLTPEQLPHFQQGYASSMADTVGRGRMSGDPYEMIYSSPNQQSKLGMVFPEGAERFARGRGLEKDMSLTSRELLGGSPTQPRAEADKAFEGGGLDGIMDFGLSLAAGTPPISAFKSKMFGARGLFGGIQDAYRMGVGKSAQHKADQIAPILLNQNPQETAQVLSEMIRQQALRNAYVQRTGMFGSAIGAPTAISLTGR